MKIMLSLIVLALAVASATAGLAHSDPTTAEKAATDARAQLGDGAVKPVVDISLGKATTVKPRHRP